MNLWKDLSAELSRFVCYIKQRLFASSTETDGVNLSLMSCYIFGHLFFGLLLPWLWCHHGGEPFPSNRLGRPCKDKSINTYGGVVVGAGEKFENEKRPLSPLQRKNTVDISMLREEQVKPRHLARHLSQFLFVKLMWTDLGCSNCSKLIWSCYI